MLGKTGLWPACMLIMHLLIISAQLPRGELLRRVLNLLNSVTAEDMASSVRFLEEVK